MFFSLELQASQPRPAAKIDCRDGLSQLDLRWTAYCMQLSTATCGVAARHSPLKLLQQFHSHLVANEPETRFTTASGMLGLWEAVEEGVHVLVIHGCGLTPSGLVCSPVAAVPKSNRMQTSQALAEGLQHGPTRPVDSVNGLRPRNRLIAVRSLRRRISRRARAIRFHVYPADRVWFHSRGNVSSRKFVD